ncbi:MAG: YncE family protein [Coleofasciculaceae cyanobacterium SM2_3_26]|nr:YncE family protein [Coleofasciculaceae cyanobacterium SM2_3_26]
MNLDDYGHAEFPGIYQGAPADVAFSSDGAHIWVANTQMHQAGARSPEGYGCGHSPRSYTSFLYRLDAATLQPDRTIPVGAGARFVAASPDGRLVLTSNWCSGDVSVVDTAQDREIYRLPLGMHPNGIAVDAGSTTAYVAIAGSTAIATVNLQDFSVGWLNSIGISPPLHPPRPQRSVFVRQRRRGK